MIITDSTKRPSERFIQIVSEFFISEGYEFKKTEKCFIRFNSKGYEKVWLNFFTTINLVSVSIGWSKTFLSLEKIFAVCKGEPKNFKKSISLYTHLPIHTRWTIPKVINTWNLFDNVTFKCDDIVLEIASTGFIKAYKTYVIRFFQYYNTYENLEQILNSLPLKNPPFSMGHFGYGKQAAFGLILSSYFGNANFSLLISQYKALSDTLPSESKIELSDIINKTLDFLKQNNIKEFLSD